MAFKWFKKDKKKSTPIQSNPPSLSSEEPLSPSTSVRPSSEENTEAIHFPADPEKKTGFLGRLKQGLSKTRDNFSSGFEKIFSGRNRIDDDLMEELEELLITSDIGIQTTMALIETVAKTATDISEPDRLKIVLKERILTMLGEQAPSPPMPSNRPFVSMIVGVNGVGKTTTIGKMAAKSTAAGEKVLIIAADTFRAAAIEQLAIWAERAGTDIVRHKDKADPSAVVYDGLEAALARNCDRVLIDTAGRLHTKVNLMEELKKIKRTVSKKIPGAPHEVMLILDATTGQNALSQATLFDEALGITGLAVTKLDGTAKGGIIISIRNTLNIPIRYIGVGENIDDLQIFDPRQYVEALF